MGDSEDSLESDENRDGWARAPTEKVTAPLDAPAAKMGAAVGQHQGNRSVGFIIGVAILLAALASAGDLGRFVLAAIVFVPLVGACWQVARWTYRALGRDALLTKVRSRRMVAIVASVALALYIVGPTPVVRTVPCPYIFAVTCLATSREEQFMLRTTHPSLRLIGWSTVTGLQGFGICDDSGYCQ